MNFRQLIAGTAMAVAAVGSAHASIPTFSAASGAITPLATFDAAGHFSTGRFTLSPSALFSLTVYAAQDDDSTPIDASVFSYASNSFLTGSAYSDDTLYTVDFTALAAGDYRVDVTGTPSAYVAISYASAAAVPEPESVALLLAGLGVVGFTLSRRRA